MRVGRFPLIGSLAVFLLSSAMLLPAQEFRATLSGIVKDPSEGAVPKARVKAVKKDSGQSYSVTTDDEGFYAIPYLIPGEYQVTVDSASFRPSVRTTVPVNVAEKRELDFTLELGSVQQEVDVTSAPEIVNTADASGGSLMDVVYRQNVHFNGMY